MLSTKYRAEMNVNYKYKIGRQKQLYTSEVRRDFVPIEKRT